MAVAEVETTARADHAAAGFGSDDVVIEVDALMRFREQLMHSLEIPVPLPADPDTGARLLDGFDTEYVRRYGVGGTALFQAVEVFAFRARASVAAGIPTPQAEARDAMPAQRTDVYWPGWGWTPTDVHRGSPHSTVPGPALIELAHTTIAVPPGASLSTGSRNELRLRLASPKES
jgi:N-methylhydantoinase A